MLAETPSNRRISALREKLSEFSHREEVDAERVVNAIAHALWVRYNSYEDAVDAKDLNLYELLACEELPKVALHLEGEALVGAGRVPQDAARMLDAALSAPDRTLSQWNYIAPEEARRIIEEWNETDAPWDSGPSIHQMFERWVERDPARLALVHGTQEVTYGALASRCSRLRYALRRSGVKPGDNVALALERNVDLVAGCMAILQAGAAYIPIDPAAPPDRIAMILEDAGAQVALTSRAARSS